MPTTPVPVLQSYLQLASKEELERLSKRTGAEIGSIRSVANGHRVCGHKLAQRIHDATDGRVPKWVLRPDIWKPGSS